MCSTAATLDAKERTAEVSNVSNSPHQLESSPLQCRCMTVETLLKLLILPTCNLVMLWQRFSRERCGTW